jgi:small subunit ribosomal protein S20
MQLRYEAANSGHLLFWGAPGYCRLAASCYRDPKGFSRGLTACAALRVIRKREVMANTRSAKKAVRRIARRTAINTNRRSRVRSFIRKVEEAIASGDQAAAAEALKAAQPEVMRGAQKGILHKNTASRKVSRLAKRIKALSA